MKIGVVCEGITDFYAINYYIGAALNERGIPAQFIPLQPLPDNTSGGGWGNVFTWLDNNPPKSREQLFGRGLFAHSKSLAGLDSIVIHLDTDILPEQSFLGYLKGRGFAITQHPDTNSKCAEVSKVIFHFAGIDQCLPEHAKKHIDAPIAESSEAWCIAIDADFVGNAESLSGQDLINAFGLTFSKFHKNKPRQQYSSINKKKKSRENYCKSTANGAARLKSCSQFVALVDKLIAIAPKLP